MTFSEIKHKIKNLGEFKSLEEIKKAGLRIVRNTKTSDYWLIEEEFLKPVVKSLKECESILIKGENLRYRVLMVNKSKEELKRKKILDYIEWGEESGVHKIESVKNRKRWYELPIQSPGNFIFSMTYGDRYLTPINENYLIDAAIYNVYIKQKFLNYKNWLKVFFNSSIFPLLVELYSRIMTGALPLAQMKVYEWYPVDLILFELNSRKEIIIARPIKSIFAELGFDPNKPIREQKPNPLPDRKALDDIVFDALGLTEEERKEVYWAVAELVQNRLKKAKSF